MKRNFASALAAALIFAAAGAPRAAQKGGWTAAVLTTEGRVVEGSLALKSVQVMVDGKPRSIALKDLLSLHTAEPASPYEQGRIAAGLPALAGPDRKSRDAAEAELTDIGLPVMTPLLASYRDTDAREPAPAYRLFARLIPGDADAPDRTLDLVRLANGNFLRGDLRTSELRLTDSAGKETVVPLASIRRLAVRRPEIRKSFELHSLRHTTPISYLDTGIAVTPASRIEEDARGYVRLSFNVDGWSSDPDGLKVPGPNYKTHLFDGFPFGALLGKIGPGGARWFAGRHADRTAMEAGRLYFGINDNPHWQNNIGAFRMTLRVIDAYDLGEPQ